MIFYLHYILMTSGLSGVEVLLAVYLQEYSDASQAEIGTLLMSFPFVGLLIKPLFCSMADRHQSHKSYLIASLVVEFVGYTAFGVVALFPSFYLNHPRLSWWALVVSTHVGNGGLGVAWSLGDALAMNMSQKTGTPFGRMRLMGTISWGVYGFIIGQINEMPALPKYLPAILILNVSLLIEIVLVICWNDDDFIMVDSLATKSNTMTTKQEEDQHDEIAMQLATSMPGSLGGTMTLNSSAAAALRGSIARSEDLNRKLQTLEDARAQTASRQNQNPQWALLKMILIEDGRFIKYIWLFTAFGLFTAPMNFIFLSMEEICLARGYNFSQLAGTVQISLSSSETVAFVFAPLLLSYLSRSICMSLTFLVMAARFVFYAGWYYNGNISPYWALVGEWAHGICYAIFCTVQADVALMFANQSRLFIGELRRLGYLRQVDPDTPQEQVEGEERKIKMALRATMQAIFDGFMSGLGMGAGALLCGVFIELYNYIKLWQFYYIIAFASIVLHQLIEMMGTKWSDTYKPQEGTKAYEIMQLNGGANGQGLSSGTKKPDDKKCRDCEAKG